MNILDAARKTIAEHGMISGGDAVLAGVSGGADSLCLLHILICLREELGFTLTAAHLNHCLRGAESDADEQLVRKICEDWGVTLHVHRTNCADAAKALGIGLEECGRVLRYEFFGGLAAGGKIALAHTLSDRTETLLFNLARGTSLRGLRSIPYTRVVCNANVIRPLLDVTRAQVEEYCAKNGIAYTVDSTNADVKYARNRIRHNIMPEMRRINPHFELAFLRMFDAVSEDAEYLQAEAADLAAQAGEAAHIQTAPLIAAAPPVLHRALRKILSARGLPISRESIMRLEAVLPGGRASLGDGMCAVSRRGMLSFQAENPVEAKPWRLTMSLGENPIPTQPGGVFRTIECALIPANKLRETINSPNRKEKVAFALDYGIIKGIATFRGREPGDKIRIAGRGCSKSLRKLFGESGLDTRERQRRIILADDDGILWLEGFGVAERAQITADAREVLVGQLRQNTEEQN
ncbi:MAG: tRNA lysidine(34) synthetase TilS [Oscillospiraceae bacterium]|jgi:tRNA(Ile)-lysidine synthase|nr:tRNA lysidine(34) synthetase TilS [Oscillospiraceae bacterium]